MSLSKQRQQGGGPGRSGGKGRQRTGPLRKIVGHKHVVGEMYLEVLECGHEQLPVQDLIGETHAVRRRCCKCARAARQSQPA